MRLWSYGEAFYIELEKCQLLCWECHQIKTHNERLALSGLAPVMEEAPF